MAVAESIFTIQGNFNRFQELDVDILEEHFLAYHLG